MDFLDTHLLSAVVFLPLLWAAFGLLIPVGTPGGRSALRSWTLAGSIVTLAFSALLYQRYQAAGAEFQLTESTPWLPVLGISYSLGIDGISLWLILLTT